LTTAGFGTSLLKIAAKIAAGPRWLSGGISIASASVAESIARLCKLQIAQDLAQYKRNLLDRHSAETRSAQAETRRKAAEAVEVENRAMMVTRRDILAAAEKRKALAEASKAEAEARKAHAEADVMQAAAAIAMARANDLRRVRQSTEYKSAEDELKKAVRRLNAKGGALLVDTDSLEGLLKTPLKSDETPES
jgi:hypothetical protein